VELQVREGSVGVEVEDVDDLGVHGIGRHVVLAKLVFKELVTTLHSGLLELQDFLLSVRAELALFVDHVRSPVLRGLRQLLLLELFEIISLLLDMGHLSIVHLPELRELVVGQTFSANNFFNLHDSVDLLIGLPLVLLVDRNRFKALLVPLQIRVVPARVERGLSFELVFRSRFFGSKVLTFVNVLGIIFLQGLAFIIAFFLIPLFIFTIHKINNSAIVLNISIVVVASELWEGHGILLSELVVFVLICLKNSFFLLHIDFSHSFDVLSVRMVLGVDFIETEFRLLLFAIIHEISVAFVAFIGLLFYVETGHNFLDVIVSLLVSLLVLPLEVFEGLGNLLSLLSSDLVLIHGSLRSPVNEIFEILIE